MWGQKNASLEGARVSLPVPISPFSPSSGQASSRIPHLNSEAQPTGVQSLTPDLCPGRAHLELSRLEAAAEERTHRAL